MNLYSLICEFKNTGKLFSGVFLRHGSNAKPAIMQLHYAISFARDIIMSANAFSAGDRAEKL